MRMRIELLAPAAALLMQANAAPAQETAGADPLRTLPIETMCGREGMFQYHFGDTNGPAMATGMPGMPNQKLPASYAPFTDAAIDSTKWSNRIYQATYTAPLADKAKALAAIELLTDRFEKLGWIAERGKEQSGADDSTFSYTPPGPGQSHLYSDREGMGASGDKGVRIELTQLGGELSFACISLPLMQAQLKEAFGDLPPGTPKPVRPELPVPPGISAEGCADPAERARILALKPNEVDPLTRYVMQRANFAERMITWKMDRLKKSGKVSPDRAFELLKAGLDDPAASKGMMAGMDLLQGVIAGVAKVEAAEKAGDPDAQCRAIANMFSGIAKLGEATDPQWKAMEAQIDREAQRLGIDLN